jgi:chitodextrinase
MKPGKTVSMLAALVLLFGTLFLPSSLAGVASAASPCASSSPPSGAYTVTVCFTAPANGSALSDAVTVTATATVTGTNPGVQRMIFYLNNAYLLTDYQSTYTFSLPTTRWVDGAYKLEAYTLMRDGFNSTRAPFNLTFKNHITSTPVNNNTFSPSTGRSGSPFVVMATGDGASGEVNAGKVITLIQNANPNLFLYLGDVYEKGAPAEFYNWYGTDGTNFGRFRSITNPTIGNHEYSASSSAAGYFDYWDNVPNYYSFDAGGWHFISLNSNSAHIGVGTGSAQYNWLQQDLAANSGACTMVYYHHPVFNIGPEGPKTVMASMWALMAQYKVTLVVNGHDHDYQRWVALDGNGNPSPTGITEFVAGGGGHGTQTIATSDSRVAYSNSASPAALGALKLTLNSNGASFSYLSINGSTLDSGSVPCQKAVTDTQAPTTPGGLAAAAASATQVNLNWQASADDVGVAGYTVYRDNAVLATVGGSQLNYSDPTASPQTTYTYAVDAYDQAGNHSGMSAPVQVTTPPASQTTSLAFAPEADTYVNFDSPGSNYGSSTTFRADGSPDVHAYLRFNVQGLAGKQIVRAQLKIYCNGSTSQGIRALQVADTGWGERTVNYTNAPALGGQIASAPSISAGTWATLDVTSSITGDGLYSFGITTPSSTAQSFPARESGANIPQLVIDVQ